MKSQHMCILIYFCPLTFVLQLLLDPIVVRNGFTYDKQTYLEILKSHGLNYENVTTPMNLWERDFMNRIDSKPFFYKNQMTKSYARNLYEFLKLELGDKCSFNIKLKGVFILVQRQNI